MQQVLVYSDSLTWGIVPTTRRRLAFEARWPGVMEIALTQRRYSVRVIEDCLNGRRTVWEDPFTWHAAQGIATLVTAILQAPIEPEMPIPSVLVIAPPPIQSPRGPIAGKFTGAAAKSAGLADAYRGIAAELGCHFFDAGGVTAASALDGIHLDVDQHQTLGQALARFVAELPGVLSPAAT